MPKFDAMKLVLDSKAIMGFNLSFFAEEVEIINSYMEQIIDWLASGKLQLPTVTEFSMANISLAHQLIQTGQSIGKIVVKCPE